MILNLAEVEILRNRDNVCIQYTCKYYLKFINFFLSEFKKTSMEPDPDEILHPGSESLAWSPEHEAKARGKDSSAIYK